MTEQIVRVRVSPDSRKESLIELKPNTFAVSVTETTERNEANTRVRFLIASYFRVPIKSVSIIAGHQSRNKSLIIRT